MRIVEVRVYRKLLPQVRGYVMSVDEDNVRDSTIVEIVTDVGLVGWGESCPAGNLYQPQHPGGLRAALELLGPALIGVDPALIGHVQRAMDGVLNGDVDAKAAVDIACWDLMGKAYNKRVCDLLGGAISDPVPTYLVVGIQPPDQSAVLAAQLQDDGVRALQLKAGRDNIEEDIAAIRAVGAVIRPGVELFVDVNRHWTVAEAIQVSNACADIRFGIEQPCNSYRECAIAKPQLRHPVLLDESATDLATIARAITEGVADGFGLKLTRVGGLSAMLAVRELCTATRTPFSCDDAGGGDIIASACVHIGSTVDPQLNRGVWIAAPLQDGHYDEENGPRIVDGSIAIPQGAGLGLNIPDGYFGDPVAVYS